MLDILGFQLTFSLLKHLLSIHHVLSKAQSNEMNFAISTFKQLSLKKYQVQIHPTERERGMKHKDKQKTEKYLNGGRQER